MSKKYSKLRKRNQSNNLSRNFGRGISNSKPISFLNSKNRSIVTPIFDENYTSPSSDSFTSFTSFTSLPNKSKVTPIFDEEIPIQSPFESLSPNMFRLIYEGDLNKGKKAIKNFDIIDFDLPLYDSIDKPGRFPETIYQRPSNKKYFKYDEEAPNPFWTNSNDDYGQYVELSKSESPTARGVIKRHNKSIRKHNKLSKRHNKLSRKPNKLSKRHNKLSKRHNKSIRKHNKLSKRHNKSIRKHSK
jgi:hypothetical protein